jgi:hypothetical protein
MYLFLFESLRQFGTRGEQGTIASPPFPVIKLNYTLPKRSIYEMGSGFFGSDVV